MSSPPESPDLSIPDRNLWFGWWSLLVYLTLGIVLEVLHGFKIGWYLNVGNETRRLMFTLAHAHGVLLALVNVAAGLTARAVPSFVMSRQVSLSLLWSGVLLPGGFLLSGFWVQDGDPGWGIILVPIGAFMLLYGVALTAWALSHPKS